MKKIRRFRRAVSFALGFFGWFVLQSIYCFLVVKFDITDLFFASVPISILTILIIYFRKQRWIACGAGVAFVLNLMSLVFMGLFGFLGEEGIGAVYILFPPFFLFFTNWP
jgi:hypothetical protein